MGYHRAGFDVVGVDIEPRPDYPFEFHQADAMTYPLDGFDAIHASPPCQRYSTATAWRGDPDSHPDLLVLVVERLTAHCVPYVVENVPGAPIEADMMLCGSMFGLPIRRHRYFVVRPTPPLQFSSGCRHRASDLAFMHKGERAYADAMGVTWTDVKSARQCIPPAYTEHIGRQMMAAMTKDEAA